MLDKQQQQQHDGDEWRHNRREHVTFVAKLLAWRAICARWPSRAFKLGSELFGQILSLVQAAHLELAPLEAPPQPQPQPPLIPGPAPGWRVFVARICYLSRRAHKQNL